MALIADSAVIQFLTSEPVLGLVKPLVIAGIIGFMLFVKIRPRLEASDKVEV